MASRRTPRPASEYSFEHSQASHVSDDGALTNAEDLLHGPRLGPSVDAFILQRHRSRLERSSRPTTPVTPQVEISPPEAAEEPVVAPATAPNAARASKSLPSVVGAIRSRGTNVVDIDSDSDSDADSIMGEAETDATLKAYLLKPRRQSFDAANTSSAGTGPGSRLRKAVFLAIEKERAKRDSESHEYRGLDWDFLTKWQKSHLAGKNGAPGSTFTGSNSGSSTLSPDETASEKDVSLGVPFRAKPKFQRRPGLPGPRFVLHAPGLQYPRTSTTFSFTPEQLQSFPWFWIGEPFLLVLLSHAAQTADSPVRQTF